jgi:sensor domain CHASE-containing protein
LSTKALAVVGTTIVALVVTLQFASRAEIQDRFERLEALYASKAIGRTEALIQQNVESVGDLAADWAAWTDMWRYMESGDRGFEGSNLTVESLENLRMNYRVITDATGRVIFADVLGDGVFTPRSESFEAELRASDAQRHGMNGKSTSGLAVVDGVVVLFASHPIVTTGGDGPVRGVLSFGRAMTPARGQGAFAPDAPPHRDRGACCARGPWRTGARAREHEVWRGAFDARLVGLPQAPRRSVAGSDGAVA